MAIIYFLASKWVVLSFKAPDGDGSFNTSGAGISCSVWLVPGTFQ